MKEITPYRHRVQYYETDKMGIVHHSNYIRWFEEARVDMLIQMGMGFDKMEERGISNPIVDVSCQYKSSARFGDEVIIYSHVRKFTGLKCIITYEIVDSLTGELRVTGSSTLGFLRTDGGIPRLKKEFPDVYEIIANQVETEK